MPGSVLVGAGLAVGVATGALACGTLPGTAPGADLIGSVVRGLPPGPAGELIGAAVACGA